MTIAAVQTQGSAASGATHSQAFDSNVTVGNRVYVVGEMVHGNDNGVFVAGDASQSAGTATLGTFQLLHQRYGTTGAGEGFSKVGIWGAEVTGTGSCTIAVGDTGATSSVTHIQILEASGDWPTTLVVEDSGDSLATGSGTNATTGDLTAADEGLFIGGVVALGAPTATPDASFTEIDESTTGGGQVLGSGIYRIVTSGGLTDAIQWTLGGTLVGHITAGVVIQEAAGGTEYTQTVTGSLTPQGALTRSTRKELAGSMTAQGLLSREVRVTQEGTIALAGTPTKQTTKEFGGSFTLQGDLASQLVVLLALQGSLTPSGSLAKAVRKLLEGTTTLAGALTKQTQISPTGSITPAGDTSKQAQVTVEGTTSPQGALTAGAVLLQAVQGALTAIAGSLQAVLQSPPSLSSATSKLRGWFGRKHGR